MPSRVAANLCRTADIPPCVPSLRSVSHKDMTSVQPEIPWRSPAKPPFAAPNVGRRARQRRRRRRGDGRSGPLGRAGRASRAQRRTRRRCGWHRKGAAVPSSDRRKTPIGEVWRAKALQMQSEPGDMRGGFGSLVQQGFPARFPGRAPGRRGNVSWRKRSAQPAFSDKLRKGLRPSASRALSTPLPPRPAPRPERANGRRRLRRAWWMPAGPPQRGTPPASSPRRTARPETGR